MATMTFSGAVNDFYAVITSVENCGIVHKYARAMGNLQQVSSILLDENFGGQLNGGFISVEAVPDAQLSLGSGGLIATFRLRYQAFYQVNDGAASEVTFRDRVFAIFTALNSGRIYAAGASQSPALVRTISYLQTDGGVLLHYADLTVDITGRVLPVTA